MEGVNHKIVEIALTRVDGNTFEQFAHVMLSTISGVDYIPLGGVHDGGADGFFDTRGVGQDVQARRFCQSSIQENHRQKIRETVASLRKNGRDPKSLTYVTAQSIKFIDREQEELTGETGVAIRIRDLRWLVSNINLSRQTVAAFESYLRPHVEFLRELGEACVPAVTPGIDPRAVSVFLRHELERRRNSDTLEEQVSDGLILWALEGTDPDKESFATKEEILAKIGKLLPTATASLEAALERRLAQRASKTYEPGRVRWYKRDGLYCLPYEIRDRLEREKVEDESLRAKVLFRMEERVQSITDNVSPRETARVAMRAVELTFQTRGLELAAFLEDEIRRYEEDTVVDHIDAAIEELEPDGSRMDVKQAAREVIRGSFYRSTPEERTLFAKLSKTSALLFSLSVDPRIVRYFQEMSSRLTLLVGTDVLVRALSEQYLLPEDRMTFNVLRMLKDAGSELVLAQPVAEEVWSHLRSSDHDFQMEYAAAEPFIGSDTIELAMHAPKILIRAYFYARTSPPVGVEAPRSWNGFLRQFVDPASLHSARGLEQIKKYLIEKFDLTYITGRELTEYSANGEIEELAGRLEVAGLGKAKVLAENDAKMALGVYGRRRNRENVVSGPFGYRTWWLTQETTIQTVTRELVREHGAGYIMRPEFLLQFIALSPTEREVREAHEAVFPTLLGIKLSNRVPEDAYQRMIRHVREAAEVDDARARVMAGDFADMLKGDVHGLFSDGADPITMISRAGRRGVPD